MDEIKKTEKTYDSIDKDDIIYKLISEKKEIEAKNKRLASILDIVTKKISGTDIKKEDMKKETDADISTIKSTTVNDSYEQIMILKKHINALKSTIEKTNNDEIKQLNNTIFEFTSRFEDIENKLAGLGKIERIENKLIDIENSIILRKKSTDNPFGMLGTIGKEKKDEEINKETDIGKNNKNEKSTGENPDANELKLKVAALTKQIELMTHNNETKAPKKDKKIETISHISESMKHLAERFS